MIFQRKSVAKTFFKNGQWSKIFGNLVTLS
nr:MAG TPA: hypothetical protein [Caudoviricetes sp.]